LLSPAGLPLKGNYRDAIRQLDYGQYADWLGYRLCRGQQGVETRIGPKPWNRLAEKLVRAHAEPQAPIRALEIIEGWADQLGACYQHEDIEEVYARVASLAHQQAFEEVPSAAELSEIWERAHGRFYHLRRVVRLQMASRGDVSVEGHRPPVVPGQDHGAPIARTVVAASAQPGPQFTLYTDGSCLRPHGVGGWAFILEGPGGAERICRAESHPATTNNRMELTAVIRGLEALPEPTRVRIVTDSRYVHDGITRWLPRWRQNRWRGTGGRLSSIALWQRLDAIIERHDVTCEWVPGHGGLAGNEEADRLARAAALAHLTRND
jgi:ribonuclease HI